MKLFIVGAGLGREALLTARAREVLEAVDVVLTTGRLYEDLRHINAATRGVALPDLSAAVRQCAGECASAAVLVSGDCGFFSVARRLLDEFCCGEGFDVECVSGLSSLQYLSAKLGMSYDDMKIVSLHGRGGDIVPHVAYNRKVFALTGGAIKAHTAIARLAAAGLGHVQVTVGENLSSPEERLAVGRADDLLHERFCDLAALVVENPNWINPHAPLTDADFLRGTAPMSKQAVRTLAIAALGIQPGDCVLDIGAGTGSVAVEMARRAHEGMVWAIERDAAAVELIRQNRQRLGAYNVEVLHAEAPAGLDLLPENLQPENLQPDAAFIGGSGGNLAETVKRLLALNPAMRLAITAITLETLHAATAALEAHGISPDVQCVNIARARRAGAYHMMQAENPVYIISANNSGKAAGGAA